MAVIEQTKWEVLPMGEYNAEIQKVEITDGFYGPQCEFTFCIEGGEHDGVNLKAWTSTKFSPKSKLYSYVRAAFGGKEIPPTYDLDTEHLIGKKLNLMVTVKVKPEDSSEFNKVDSVRPYRELGGGRAPLPQGSGQPATQGNGQPPAPPAQAAQAAPAHHNVPPREADEIPF